MELEKEHIDFLDELRDSAVTNMMGAGPYLQEEFGFDRREAKEIVLSWMKLCETRARYARGGPHEH